MLTPSRSVVGWEKKAALLRECSTNSKGREFLPAAMPYGQPWFPNMATLAYNIVCKQTRWEQLGGRMVTWEIFISYMEYLGTVLLSRVRCFLDFKSSPPYQVCRERKEAFYYYLAYQKLYLIYGNT